MQLKDLQDIDYVTANLEQVLQYHKLITKQLDYVKEIIKSSGNTIMFGDVEGKYSSYIKLVPTDIEKILEKYPIEEYKDIYNISVNKEGQSIIKEESLFEEQEIQSVSFKTTE